MSLIPSVGVPEAAEPLNKGLILIGISKKENRSRLWKYTKTVISSFLYRSTKSFLQTMRRSCDEPPKIYQGLGLERDLDSSDFILVVQLGCIDTGVHLFR